MGPEASFFAQSGGGWLAATAGVRHQSCANGGGQVTPAGPHRVPQ